MPTRKSTWISREDRHDFFSSPGKIYCQNAKSKATPNWRVHVLPARGTASSSQMHSEIPLITNLVCDTHITWSMSASENCKNLLVMMELASAKPNREWSVNRVWSPIVRAWRSASWHKVEKALKRSQHNEWQIHVHVSYLRKPFLPKKKGKQR